MSNGFFTIDYQRQKEELKKWKIYGFTNLEAKKWKKKGFDLETAKIWYNGGFTVKGAIIFIKEGLTPQESKELIIREITKGKKISITLTEGIYTRDQILELIQKERMKEIFLI